MVTDVVGSSTTSAVAARLTRVSTPAWVGVNVYDQDSGLPSGWVGCQAVPPSREISTPTMPPASPFTAPPRTVSGLPVPTSAPAAGDETHDEGWSSGDAAAPR